MKKFYFITNSNKSITALTLRAFTLVEMLVVLGLFSGIMTMATGALFSSQAVNVRLQSTQAVLDNVNLSMEVITQDIRHGTWFHCGSSFSTSSPVTLSASNELLRRDCTYQQNGSSTLLFKPTTATSDSDRNAYFIQNGVLYMNEYRAGVLYKSYQITSNDVLARSLVFYVKGANNSSSTQSASGGMDYEQPIITVTFSGVTDPPKKSFKTVTTTGVGRADVTTRENARGSKFTIQTSISPRGLDDQ